MRSRLTYQGPAVRWMPRRRRCIECGKLCDWRPGGEGRIYVRQHYRIDRPQMEYCITTWQEAQRPLDAWFE